MIELGLLCALSQKHMNASGFRGREKLFRFSSFTRKVRKMRLEKSVIYSFDYGEGHIKKVSLFVCHRSTAYFFYIYASIVMDDESWVRMNPGYRKVDLETQKVIRDELQLAAQHHRMRIVGIINSHFHSDPSKKE